MYVVTITKPCGYVYNHLVPGNRLRTFLALASSVLLPGEALTYRHQADAATA